MGGENYSRLALGCSHVHVFIRYIIFRLSKLLPPLSYSQSDRIHCAEHQFPYNSALQGRLDLGARIHS